mmetsp:Transcript_64910/g.155030  ORF Transcript_64910/g.155030 Transcript_64910/m.155030 type:complete len:284 (-) Transcript_64910:241-1092(-)
MVGKPCCQQLPAEELLKFPAEEACVKCGFQLPCVHILEHHVGGQAAPCGPHAICIRCSEQQCELRGSDALPEFQCPRCSQRLGQRRHVLAEAQLGLKEMLLACAAAHGGRGDSVATKRPLQSRPSIEDLAGKTQWATPLRDENADIASLSSKAWKPKRQANCAQLVKVQRCLQYENLEDPSLRLPTALEKGVPTTASSRRQSSSHRRKSCSSSANQAGAGMLSVGPPTDSNGSGLSSAETAVPLAAQSGMHGLDLLPYEAPRTKRLRVEEARRASVGGSKPPL